MCASIGQVLCCSMFYVIENKKFGNTLHYLQTPSNRRILLDRYRLDTFICLCFYFPPRVVSAIFLLIWNSSNRFIIKLLSYPNLFSSLKQVWRWNHILYRLKKHSVNREGDAVFSFSKCFIGFQKKQMFAWKAFQEYLQNKLTFHNFKMVLSLSLSAIEPYNLNW